MNKPSVFVDLILDKDGTPGIKCIISYMINGHSVKISEQADTSDDVMGYLRDNGPSISSEVRDFINSDDVYRGSDLVIRTNSKSTINRWDSSVSNTSAGLRGGKVAESKAIFDKFLLSFEDIPVRIMFVYVKNLSKYNPVYETKEQITYDKPSELFEIQ